MKFKLMILSAVIVACVCVAATLDDIAKDHIKSMTADGSITNVLKMVLSDGTFCQVRGGHDWQGGCGMSGCLVFHGSPIRHCLICRKTETQEVGPWK